MWDIPPHKAEVIIERHGGVTHGVNMGSNLLCLQVYRFVKFEDLTPFYFYSSHSGISGRRLVGCKNLSS